MVFDLARRRDRVLYRAASKSFSAAVLLGPLRPLYRLVCQAITTETGPIPYGTYTTGIQLD